MPAKKTTRTPGHTAGLLIAEWITAVVLTIAALVLHLINRAHVGALWRDELNSVHLATMPTLRELWQNFEFDSVPAIWLTLLRLLHGIGFGSDAALRNLGLLIGLLFLAILWLNARRLTSSPPLVALALIGLSPVVVRWGDGLRAYGLGMIFSVLTFGMVWAFVQKPNTRTFAIALLCALCSVHTLYYNSVLIFAICSGGAVLTATGRQWKLAALILAIGGITALTLLVYSAPLARQHEWYVLVQQPAVTFGFLFQKLGGTLSTSGTTVAWLWAVSVIGTILIATVSLTKPETLTVTESQRSLLIYSLATLLIGSVAYALFLKSLNYVTYPWYYVGWMSLTAITTEAGLIPLRNRVAGRLTIAAFAGVMLVVSFFNSAEALKARLTNIDLVAGVVSKNTTEHDCVVVNPWFVGITFRRYYTGPASWITLPSVSDHRVHRYDEVKTMMSQAAPLDAIRPITDKITETLRGGGHVWLVGGLSFPPANQIPFNLPPAPGSPYGWNNGAYYEMWSQNIGRFVQQHALQARVVEVPNAQKVADYENLPIVFVEGWRD